MRFSAVLALLLIVAASPVIAATEVAPGVTLIPGKFIPNEQPDGNTVVFHGARGLVVFDTGRHPEHTQAIIDYARKSGQPVEAIINSHWHLDHISGNPMMRREYPKAKVYASGALSDALKGFLAEERAQLADLLKKDAPEAEKQGWRAELATIDAGASLRPDEVVTRSGNRKLAGRTLYIGLESHAVTAGDVWVFDPSSGVLASGDLITVPVPFLDTACPAKWKASLDTLSKVSFKVVIPGHGVPMRRPDFEAYRTAFGHLLSCAATRSEESVCADGWMTDAAPLLKDSNPKFVRSLLGYYITEQLRGDPARIAKLCGSDGS